MSHDYGGKTVIKASATYAGQIYTAELKIPKDTDNDGLPDKFELDTVLNPGAVLNPLVADTDSDSIADAFEDQEGAAGEDPGDGLTAFEEYRGVRWNNEHKRLSAIRKDVFVAAVDFDGTGVTFQLGGAFLNAGVDVHWIKTVSASSVWNEIQKNFEDQNIDVGIIRSYSGIYAGGDMNSGHIRRLTVRIWDIPILGESYFGGDTYYGQPTKIYATPLSNYVQDRPYWDKETKNAGTTTYNPTPNTYLDPKDNVEDGDDNGVQGSKEDSNRNGVFEGDRVEMSTSTWNNPAKLNPFNADNDSWVELPQVNGLPEPLLVKGQKVTGEYERYEVDRHVITHELGHMVGMGLGEASLVDNLGHCFDTNCVMHKTSIDWKRQNYFCPYHRSLIKAHND
jgi:hypothetical protein